MPEATLPPPPPHTPSQGLWIWLLGLSNTLIASCPTKWLYFLEKITKPHIYLAFFPLKIKLRLSFCYIAVHFSTLHTEHYPERWNCPPNIAHAHCILHNAQCTLHTSNCTLHNTQHYSLQITYFTHCALCIVHHNALALARCTLHWHRSFAQLAVSFLCFKQIRMEAKIFLFRQGGTGRGSLLHPPGGKRPSRSAVDQNRFAVEKDDISLLLHNLPHKTVYSFLWCD